MSSTGDRAEIQLGVRGQEETIRAADDVRAAYVRSASGIADSFRGVGGHIRGAVGSAVTSVGSSLSTLAQDSIRVATALHNISLAGAVDDAKRFDEALGRLVAAKGVQLADFGGSGMFEPPLPQQQAFSVRSRIGRQGQHVIDRAGDGDRLDLVLPQGPAVEPQLVDRAAEHATLDSAAGAKG